MLQRGAPGLTKMSKSIIGKTLCQIYQHKDISQKTLYEQTKKFLFKNSQVRGLLTRRFPMRGFGAFRSLKSDSSKLRHHRMS